MSLPDQVSDQVSGERYSTICYWHAALQEIVYQFGTHILQTPELFYNIGLFL